MSVRPLVAVVDDDESVRESLPDLLRVLGYDAVAFSSAEAFLASANIPRTDALVLDIAMPGMSGPDLVEELRRLGHQIPVVFITAHRDVDVGSASVARLLKPFSDTELATELETALRAER
jgi:FixJ family two-component response regulator